MDDLLKNLLDLAAHGSPEAPIGSTDWTHRVTLGADLVLTRAEAAAPEPLRVAETTGQIDPEAIEALCQRLELRVENATEYAVTATQKSAREELLRAAQTMRALLSHWEQARLDYSAESILVQEMHTLRSERDAAEALASTAPLRVAGEEVERLRDIANEFWFHGRNADAEAVDRVLALITPDQPKQEVKDV